MLQDELGGMLAELARCASRAFIELFGCVGAPERVKGRCVHAAAGTPNAGRRRIGRLQFGPLGVRAAAKL